MSAKRESQTGRTPKKQSGAKAAKADSQKKTPRGKQKARPPANKPGGSSLTVVGVGASAGGLEALEGFLRNLKGVDDIALVVVQHRAAGHKSVMPSLLEKYTPMKVFEVEDGTRVEPGCTYISPPHRDLTIDKGVLHCSADLQQTLQWLPIDSFLKSLAKDCKEHSICVILSGTGTDGTLGLRSIKEVGGLTMVQDEKQAKYMGMPRSAIDTGLVDLVLPVEKMGEEIARYIRHPYIRKPAAKKKVDEDFESNLKSILALVRSRTGHDFSDYKRSTVQRRLERRMALNQIAGASDYLRFLRKNDREVSTLFRELLITVTSFFREPKAWEALKEKVARELVGRIPVDSIIRIWVPGCATGEEAYSAAMVFVEEMERVRKRINFQVFATDLDPQTIANARYGSYPRSIAANVSKQRLKRFFKEEEDFYVIKKEIRDLVVFAVQDLIKDPPFSRLDLVCCRNVLIYMEGSLQKKLLPLFHYILNPDGFLFLGTSETIGGFSDRFSLVDSKWRIFRRKPDHIPKDELPSILLRGGRGAVIEAKTPKTDQAVDTTEMARRLILRECSLPCLLVNEQYDVMYINSGAGKFLYQPAGEPSLNVLKLARPELSYAVNASLHRAATEKRTVERKAATVKVGRETETVDIVVKPVEEEGADGRMFLVIFREAAVTDKARDRQVQSQGTDQDGSEARSLRQELQSTREYLQTTIEELETANEELKSSNEELQSTNEELQSTNEELETSREELQSTNEELRTVNTEHQDKIEQLARANDDLNNLLASTAIGTIFLDMDLKVKRFTPQARQLFRLIGSDIGRPLDEIAGNFEYREVMRDAEAVLNDLHRREVEIEMDDGRCFLLRILPYRTTENVIDGVVVTGVDITEAKDSQRYAESIVDTIRQPLLVLDKDLKVISASEAFYRQFKVSPEQTEGKLVYDLGNRQWDIPKFRELLEEILPENTSFEEFEVEHDFPDIGKRRMLLNARRVFLKGEQTDRILLAIEDVTEKK